MALASSIAYKKGYSILEFGLDDEYLNWHLAHYLPVEVINDIPLSETQIEIFSDIVDWDLVSTKKLSTSFVVFNKSRINWPILIESDLFDSVVALMYAEEQIEANINFFREKRIKKKFYGGLFIRYLPEYVDWKWLIKKYYLKDELLLEYWDYFHINDISKYQKLTYKVASLKLKEICWKYASKNRLSYDIIELAQNYLDWKAVSRYQKNMPMSIIKKYIKYIDWHNISRYQQLSMDFIETYMCLLTRKYIWKYQNLTLDFIKKFDKIIDMSILMNNVHMNKPGAIQISSNKNRYFIIAPMSEISNINYVT